MAGLLSACAPQPVRLVATNHQTCIAPFTEALKQRQYTPYFEVKGAPFLRVNRDLAARFDSAATQAERLHWLQWANLLASEALQLEVPACMAPVLASIAGDTPSWAALKTATTIPDEYRTGLRAIGLYPLTRLAFLAGVEGELNHMARQQADFSPAAAEWRYFKANFVRESFTASAHFSALFSARALVGEGLPADVAAWSSLFSRWAPVFAVADSPAAVAGANMPGRLGRTDNGLLEFNTGQPLMYVYPSLGRFEGAPVLQLNYQIWFAERPAKGPLDVLAGTLDGIHWRVHLAADGRPIAYDAMHTCGCWYQLYPAKGYQSVPNEDFWQEPHFVGGELALGEGPVVYLSENDHALLGVGNGPVNGTFVQLGVAPVQWAGVGIYSRFSEAVRQYWAVFDARGVVPESGRSEALFFWPMGVPATGSHRAPGHHAVAFTGRRHFDDPTLLDELIRPKP
ncbi:hypothetical protein L1F30_09450 [Simiduia sp. 21SJ11W-1]|uniref:hypothetical protein n=1 Tax=Simiduia sp. 21SJ11W-1 TaxID=2909669 RepID=UPI0020A151C5|nr:hypothetical protein [Simiduia sp. 21SJ11W-1]UTA46398.1 hypothetical protein L1F30_09450 [Simiduia sp. 21SJ11W-1]